MTDSRPGEGRRGVDLRTDVITLPTEEMWEAMRTAELGWAAAGEDASVLELEAVSAELAGKEAALFLLSGCTGNLVALMTHTERGDQVVLEASSHILWCEEWSLAYVCSLVPRAVAGTRGRMDPADVRWAIEEAKYRHRPRTSLLCLENTDNIAGAALDPERADDLAAVAHELGASVHVDGARIFNACVAVGVDLRTMLAGADSAVLNLNKGLSAPGGAVLVGSADFIARSRVNLRRIGGASLHQGGIFAAAGLEALRTMVPRLAEDHRRAAELAALLDGVDGLAVDREGVQTNIVNVTVDENLTTADAFLLQLAEEGVLGYLSGPQVLRFVTHRHIGDGDIAHASGAIEKVALRARTPAR